MTTLLPNDRIFRYEVPVDDQWHPFDLKGDPLHVDCRTAHRVEFWARHYDHDPAAAPAVRRQRWLRVVGTGHPVPDRGRYWGTAMAGPLVWHLIERDGDEP